MRCHLAALGQASGGFGHCLFGVLQTLFAPRQSRCSAPHSITWCCTQSRLFALLLSHDTVSIDTLPHLQAAAGGDSAVHTGTLVHRVLNQGPKSTV